MNIQEVFTPVSWDHLLKKGDKPKKDQLGEKIKELENKIDKLNKNISALDKDDNKKVPSLKNEVALLRSSLKTELSKHPIGRQIQEVEAKIEEIDSRRSKRREMKLVAEVKTMDRDHRGGERVAKESHLAARDLNER